MNLNHQSNGNIKQPNKGINWPTAGLSISYQKNAGSYDKGLRLTKKPLTHNSPRYDIGIFGIVKRALSENVNSRRLLLVGISFQASKQVGNINALTLGAEFFRDASLHTRLKQDSINASSVRAGVLVGHEFILGKFLISQRLGVYIFDQTPYYDQIYHRWGLYYRINRRFGTGLSLLVHRHIADFVDLKLTYSMQKI